MAEVKPPPSRSHGVSCLCLTYGRPHLLEEAIESFLRQDWPGEKELIVLNDHPAQQLAFAHPEVSIINLPRRLRTLGEKRNLSVALARHDNLLIWDDDDIYLPWRITETMKTLPTAQFFKCPNAWCITDGEWQPQPSYNLFHSGSGYTRWLFERAGGYEFVDGGEDARLEWRFQTVTLVKGEYWPHTILPNDRLYYVYRWGHGSYHTTGRTSLESIRPEVTPGVVQLRPHWRKPYDQIALAHARRISS
jgi:glycosyltransferase involved in cell wall biosynthesis